MVYGVSSTSTPFALSLLYRDLLIDIMSIHIYSSGIVMQKEKIDFYIIIVIIMHPPIIDII